MRTLIIVFIIALSPMALSQNQWWKKSKEVTEEKEIAPQEVKKYESPEEVYSIKQPGKITVSKNASVEKVIRYKASTIPPYVGPTFDGFRVQIFFDQSRTEVEKARAKAMTLDNQTPTYIEYKAPNYLLHFGDYRTQIEAEYARAQLINEFPEAIIKEQRIYLPKMKEIIEEED